MTIALAQLVAPSELTGAAAVYYTGPVNTTTRIDRATFTNNSGSAATISVYIVPLGGSPTAANIIIDAQSVSNGTCYVSPELAGAVLPPGTTLQALSGTASVIVMQVSGITSS